MEKNKSEAIRLRSRLIYSSGEGISQSPDWYIIPNFLFVFTLLSTNQQISFDGLIWVVILFFVIYVLQSIISLKQFIKLIAEELYDLRIKIEEKEKETRK